MNLLQGPRILILLLLISFASISAVLFTPALPELARYFGISDGLAQATMSIFLVGYALGQLPYAPLANRFGRKKTIYIGLTLALFGTLFCWLAPTFEWLLIGRFLQALGASVGLKITFTMIGDSHVGAQATKTLSYIMLAFAITPGIGVAIGGFITLAFGWKGCFFFMMAYTFLLALLCLLLPETAHHIDKEALKPKKILHGYLCQLKSPAVMLHALIMGLTTAIVYIFATQAPYIGINQIGLAPNVYGLYNIIPPLGMATGMLLSSRFADKISPRMALLTGICIIFLAVFAMTTFFYFQILTPWTLFIPQAIVLIGNSLIFTNSSSMALSAGSDKSNTSAVVQFTNVGLSAVGSYLISSWLPKVPITLPLTYGVIALLCTLLWLKLKPYHRHAKI